MIGCCCFGGLQCRDHEPIAHAAGRIEPLAVATARQARGDLSGLVLRELDDLAARQTPVGKAESVDNVVFTAAGQQVVSAGSETEAVECLGQRDARKDGGSLQIDDDDFMRSITGVQHRGPIAAGVQGDIHRKIPHLDLRAGWSQRPLIGQENGAIGLDSRQGPRRQVAIGSRFFGGDSSGKSCGENRRQDP